MTTDDTRTAERHLTFPVTDRDALRELRAGDRLRIDGHVIGIPRRDADRHVSTAMSGRAWT